MSVSGIDYKRLLPFFALFLLIFTGCAGPLEVKYEPRTQGQFKTKEALPVFVSRFEDKRDLSKSPFKDPRTIGRILSTVSDMNASELTLSENAADITTRAFEKELALSGFTVVTEAGKAGYVVSGEVREFSLNVGSTDDIAIEISSVLKEAGTGKTLWTGVEAEKGERFAGVMGNSRTTLSNHIAASLQKAVRRSIAEMGAHLPAVAGGAPIIKDEAGTQPDMASGTAAINSAPERAKVYIDGVYYGLTPLKIDLAPGVYEITLKNKGFQQATEKVSIRQGTTTELEMELEKE